MIFHDRLVIRTRNEVYVSGTLTYVYTSQDAYGLVTFLDSARGSVSANDPYLIVSRFRIYIAPYTDPPLAPVGVDITWKDFAHLPVEGMVEPHYMHGRLHHYECVTKTPYD